MNHSEARLLFRTILLKFSCVLHISRAIGNCVTKFVIVLVRSCCIVYIQILKFILIVTYYEFNNIPLQFHLFVCLFESLDFQLKVYSLNIRKRASLCLCLNIWTFTYFNRVYKLKRVDNFLYTLPYVSTKFWKVFWTSRILIYFSQ